MSSKKCVAGVKKQRRGVVGWLARAAEGNSRTTSWNEIEAHQSFRCTFASLAFSLNRSPFSPALKVLLRFQVGIN